jgi:hypothetical protein
MMRGHVFRCRRVTANAFGRAIARSSVALATLAMMTTTIDAADAAPLQAQTLRAWQTYVAAVEARIARELSGPGGFLVSDTPGSATVVRARLQRGERVVAKMSPPSGAPTDVPGGQIAHWRGSLLVPGVTLADLLHRLQNPPEAGPHQEDVVSLRVLARQPDRLQIAIRMQRTKVVTVTYDSEHDISYQRHGSTRASSRSIATRIVELAAAGTPAERVKRPGEDRGFLWRMQSYWRYEEVENGVIVEMESLTLSRSVPFGLSLVVQPIVDDIARESIHRTLDHLRRMYGKGVRGERRGD